jgi:hypothetical protein
MILFGMIVGIPAAVAVGASVAAAVTQSSGSLALMAGALILTVVGWVAVSRLSLALPAAAVDEGGSRLAMAWQRGKGNMLGLFFGPIVCALPFLIVSFVLNMLFFALMHVSPMMGALRVAVVAALGFVQAALTVSFLSFCYKQLVDVGAASPRRMAGPAAMPAE